MPHPDTEQVASAKKAAAIKASNAARVKAAALRSTPGLTADDPRLATLTTCRSSHDQQHVHGARAPPQRRGDELDVWLTFTDLKRAGVVDSWQTLLRGRTTRALISRRAGYSGRTRAGGASSARSTRGWRAGQSSATPSRTPPLTWSASRSDELRRRPTARCAPAHPGANAQETVHAGHARPRRDRFRRPQGQRPTRHHRCRRRPPQRR